MKLARTNNYLYTLEINEFMLALYRRTLQFRLIMNRYASWLAHLSEVASMNFRL